MILTWILVSLALLASSSPQNRDLRRRDIHRRGNVILFPGGENDDFISEEDYIELPDWMDIDLNELSLDKLEVLNNATDLTDLAKFFGLDYENAAKLAGQPDMNQSDIENRMETGSSSAKLVEENGERAKFAKCSPEEVTVELTPVSSNTIHLPSCVRLKRCGGCCNSDLLSCQPAKVEVVSLKVLKISKRKSHRRSSRRQRRRRGKTLGQVVSISQDSHVECSCQCKVQEKHCDPQLHNYSKDGCACVCKDETEQRKCEKSSKLHNWDQNTCSCICKKVKECGTGELFSQDSCRCVPAFSFPVGSA